MMTLLINFALVTLAIAAPLAELDRRQTTSVEKEFSNGPCRDIIFFFARGSTEGESVGPAVSDGLKSHYGDARVATEGVDYDAGLATNFLPGGADPVGVTNMNNLFKAANTKCPNSVVVGSGYSQGAAVIHHAIQPLSSAVIAQIAGAVTFGDTQYVQDGGRIPNYPTSDTLIICNVGDLVCDGTLIITAAHLAYVPRAPEAISFLIGKIDVAL